MADEKHLLVEISGGYVDTSRLKAEIWATTLRFGLIFGGFDPTGTLPNNWAPEDASINRTETNWTIEGVWSISGFAVDDWMNDQVAPAVATWFSVPEFASQALVKTIKVYPIGSPTGRAVPPPSQTQGSPITLTWTSGNPQGTSSTNMLPAQDSIVASHRTQQTGRRGRGRMYRPAATRGLIDLDGFVSTGSAATILAAQIALLEGCSFAGTLPNVRNVRPIVTGKPFVKYGTITTVDVGDVIDTQQRRRNALLENRVSGNPSY